MQQVVYHYICDVRRHIGSVTTEPRSCTFLMQQLSMTVQRDYAVCIKLGTRYPYSRAVDTAREHGCHFGHPWTRTGPCSRLVWTANTGVQNDARVGHPCWRPVKTSLQCSVVAANAHYMPTLSNVLGLVSVIRSWIHSSVHQHTYTLDGQMH